MTAFFVVPTTMSVTPGAMRMREGLTNTRSCLSITPASAAGARGGSGCVWRRAADAWCGRCQSSACECDTTTPPAAPPPNTHTLPMRAFTYEHKASGVEEPLCHLHKAQAHQVLGRGDLKEAKRAAVDVRTQPAAPRQRALLALQRPHRGALHQVPQQRGGAGADGAEREQAVGGWAGAPGVAAAGWVDGLGRVGSRAPSGARMPRECLRAPTTHTHHRVP